MRFQRDLIVGIDGEMILDTLNIFVESIELRLRTDAKNAIRKSKYVNERDEA